MNKKINLFAVLAFMIYTASPSALLARPSQKASPPLADSGPHSSIYKTLGARKNLSSSPNFIVLDDFNRGRLKIPGGADWKTEPLKTSALQLGIDKTDALNEGRGYSLKALLEIPSGKTVSFFTPLARLDASRAENLVFKSRLVLTNKETPYLKMEVILEDWKHRKSSREVTLLPAANGRDWAETDLLASEFRGVDFDSIINISFSIQGSDEPVAGALWLDEIAFYSKGDIAFESHRDNLIGFPAKVFDNERREELRHIAKDKKLLNEIARDTWKYFENARDRRTNLIADHIRLGEAPLAADYTSPTNIAMDLLGIIAAMDLNFISKKEARKRTGEILGTLSKMPRHKNFFFNFYDTKTLEVTRSYLSSVDSGWLAVALVVVRQTFKGNIAAQATKFLDAFKFDEFLDPENNQLVVGIDVPEKNFGNYHYGLLSTEARITSFYAIGKGDIPRDHWWYIYRTLPNVWNWQTQQPKGKQVSKGKVEYFQGYYENNGKKFIPSWGGSLFEFLMPTLVLREKELAPKGLGLNDRVATELQRDYALKEKKYPVWGISPAAVTNGRQWRYGEFGIRALGAKGYPDRGVLTPHVSFLALDPLPKDAIANIRRFLDFEIYGEYGFFDTFNAATNKANPQYLALDQGMILVAIANYLKDGSIQKRFHQDQVAKNAQDLLTDEEFFNV